MNKHTGNHQSTVVEIDESSDTLSFLAEMGQTFASTHDIDASLNYAIKHIASHVGAEAGALFMLSDDEKNLECHACYGEVDIVGMSLKADQGIVGFSVQNNSTDIVRDVNKDDRFHRGVDQQSGFVTRSIMCAPLSVKGNSFGAIELINKNSGDHLFDNADLALLTTLANSAALAISNAIMAENLVEQERLGRELELAAEIQRSLLPTGEEDLPIWGANIPARTVSGDFFDYFELEDGRIVFNLGDVSGKGMNAALLMAKTASLFRCLSKSIEHPGRLLGRINTELCETSTRGMFVTMVAGIFDPKTGRLRISNAGHEPPLVRDAQGNYRSIPAEAPPLGIDSSLARDNGFPVANIDLNGGTFYLFTDGVTEGYIAEGQALGSDGVESIIDDAAGLSVRVPLQKIIDLIGKSGVPLHDDLTVLGIQDDLSNRDKTETNKTVIPMEPTSEPAAELASISTLAEPDRLKMVRSMLTEAARSINFSNEGIQDLVLAVDEACQNVIRYAYNGEPGGKLKIVLTHDSDHLIIEICDQAATVDPATIKHRDIDDVRPGGLGTYLMDEIMDCVEYLPLSAEGGNILRMVKTIG